MQIDVPDINQLITRMLECDTGLTYKPSHITAFLSDNAQLLTFLKRHDMYVDGEVFHFEPDHFDNISQLCTRIAAEFEIGGKRPTADQFELGDKDSEVPMRILITVEILKLLMQEINK